MTFAFADGNFHTNIPYQRDDAKTLQAMERVEARLIRRAVRMGGAVSGEHGIGIGKRKHMEFEHGPVHVAVQKQIKLALDPNLIMNPGKLFQEAPQRRSAKL